MRAIEEPLGVTAQSDRGSMITRSVVALPYSPCARMRADPAPERGDALCCGLLHTPGWTWRDTEPASGQAHPPGGLCHQASRGRHGRQQAAAIILPCMHGNTTPAAHACTLSADRPPRMPPQQQLQQEQQRLQCQQPSTARGWSSCARSSCLAWWRAWRCSGQRQGRPGGTPSC